MSPQAIREGLTEARAELAKLDEEREAWLNLIKGYEAILRLRGNGPDAQLPLAIAEAKVASRTETKPGAAKAPSFRSSMKRVLQEAHGEPLHTKEILRRVRELGADTTAKDPLGVTDLMGYSLAKSQEIEKVGPRTWRWAGPDRQ